MLGKGDELVISVSFALLVASFLLALFLCSSFSLLSPFWWFFLGSKDGHAVYCVVVGSDGRVENVQWGTMFCVKGGL